MSFELVVQSKQVVLRWPSTISGLPNPIFHLPSLTGKRRNGSYWKVFETKNISCSYFKKLFYNVFWEKSQWTSMQPRCVRPNMLLLCNYFFQGSGKLNVNETEEGKHWISLLHMELYLKSWARVKKQTKSPSTCAWCNSAAPGIEPVSANFWKEWKSGSGRWKIDKWGIISKVWKIKIKIK